jgi:fructan beta-fructosidase
VTRFEGERVRVSGTENDRLKASFGLIFLNEEIKTETPVYSEKLRQQLHFSSRRGWNNDPNGLVYYAGEYHLYYQHNPYGWDWGNMHWGHAVSSDLIHWEELPDVLYPDQQGTMFSGSAVLDHNNTSGFQKGEEKVIVAAYTADSEEGQSQCIAYSNDRGRSFTKYKKNPVIPSIQRFGDRNERDPKVFWYVPGNHWVMVLFESTGLSIYTSGDLKKWNYESHVEGFRECPELFELALDNDPNNKKWVMYGGSGKYKIGSFDGKIFVPETDILLYNIWILHPTVPRSRQYAAQTFNNTPDGRRIQVCWGIIPTDGMPFNNMITFPTEMSLKTGAFGPMLHSNPIEEISTLFQKSYRYDKLSTGKKDLNEMLDQIESPLLHVKLEAKCRRQFSILLNGYKFTYNPKSGNETETFIPSIPYTPVNLEFIIDVNSIELFINDGQGQTIIPHHSTYENQEIKFEFSGEIFLETLQINELTSIWEKTDHP